MKRREFLAGIPVLGVVSARALAQRPGSIRRVGALFTVGPGDPEAMARSGAFERGLTELGWNKGQNLQIDYYFTGGDAAKLRIYSTQLLANNPDVILANGPAVVRALGGKSQKVPMVFALVPDPVGDGLVDSLARPGGRLTGFTNFEYSMGSKWMELLREVAPKVKRAGVIYNPAMAPYASLYIRSIDAGRPVFGIEPFSMPVRDVDDLKRSMNGLANDGAVGVIVLADLFTTGNNELIVSLAQDRRLPGIFPFSYFTRKGGLLSYGVDTSEPFYKAARYVDRILKGANPADLPVQQPTRFELVINLKTAKALGIEVPPMLLARADEVIE